MNFTDWEFDKGRYAFWRLVWGQTETVNSLKFAVRRCGKRSELHRLRLMRFVPHRILQAASTNYIFSDQTIDSLVKK